MAMYPVPITKAKKTLAVDSSEFTDEIFQAIFAEGLKALLNKNMSKILTKDLDGDELEAAQASAMEKAQENLERLKSGAIKKRKSTKESREVTTEARRLAREAVKAAYKKAGKKITGIKGAVITAAADELIAENPKYLEKARENVAKMKARDTIEVVPEEGSTIAKLIAEAETAKPKVAPTRKKKTEGASAEDVVAAAKTSKGKAQPAHAKH